MLVEKDLLLVETFLLHGCLCTVLEVSLSHALWVIRHEKKSCTTKGGPGVRNIHPISDV